MRILPLDALPAPLRSQLGALAWLDGDPPQALEFVRRVRRSGYPMTDYFGVYAVEADQLLGHVESIDLTVTTAWGEERAVGLADVLTRADALGRGIAGRLIEDVHHRARAKRVRWALLWTHRTWGAHRLYERLGYRDVFSPPAALKAVPKGRNPALPLGYAWQIAAERDLPRLQRLRALGARGRFGFVPRPAGPFRARFRLAFRKPSEHRILRRGSVDVGYAYVTTAGTDVVMANEVVVVDPAHAEPMLIALEREARGRWLAVGTTTFLLDSLDLFRSRGYQYYPTSHRVLMARSLAGGRPDERTRAFWACFADPRFSFHRGDMF